MLPWNYGFHWNAGHIIFLGAFYCVLSTLAVTLIAAARRTRRALLQHRVEEIGWHEDFHDLPARDRVCRHVLTGEFQSRQCPHAFDCRQCETHAKLIQRHPLPKSGQPEEDLFGMAFPLDRFYHRGHTWVLPEEDGTLTVGLDEFADHLIGHPDSVQLPILGSEIESDGIAWRMKKNGHEIRIPAPIEGTVVATGGEDEGWYLKILPHQPVNLRHLLRGAEVAGWLAGELDRLQLQLSAPDAPQCLADGGALMPELMDALPAADWDAVLAATFLER